MAYVSARVSDKIKLLSFVASIAVVVRHANPLAWTQDPVWAGWMGTLIDCAQQWAVPYFFIVSGFFFDRGYIQREVPYSEFAAGKIRSLLIPYLLWGAVYGTVVATSLCLLTNYLGGRELLHGTVFCDGWFNAVNRVVGILHRGPLNRSLWYVRVLLILFAVAPLLKWLGLKLGKTLLPLALIIILAFSPVTFASSPESIAIAGSVCQFKVCSIGWFLLGMWCSIAHVEGFTVGRSVAFLLLFVWLIVNVLFVASVVSGDSPLQIVDYAYRVSPLLLVIVWWSAVDVIPLALQDWLKPVVGLSFWIYVMHAQLVSFLYVAETRLLGNGVWAGVVKLAVTAPVLSGVTILAGCFVRRYCPALFSVLMGGRVRTQKEVLR